MVRGKIWFPLTKKLNEKVIWFFQIDSIKATCFHSNKLSVREYVVKQSTILYRQKRHLFLWQLVTAMFIFLWFWLLPIKIDNRQQPLLLVTKIRENMEKWRTPIINSSKKHQQKVPRCCFSEDVALSFYVSRWCRCSVPREAFPGDTRPSWSLNFIASLRVP